MEKYLHLALRRAVAQQRERKQEDAQEQQDQEQTEDMRTVINKDYMGVKEFPGGIATRPLWVKPGASQFRTP